jgi:hypothetical protein
MTVDERGCGCNGEGVPLGGIGAGSLRLTDDGRLTCWDVFNRDCARRRDGRAAEEIRDRSVSGGEATRATEVDQGFALRLRTATGTLSRTLDRRGFPGARFTGAYPFGQIEYDDPVVPVDVRLDAFSPFIPLNVEESSLPATVLTFTLRNRSRETVEATLAGWLENALCACTGREFGERVTRRNRAVRTDGLTGVLSTAHERPLPDAPPRRPPVLIADLGSDGYRAWTPEGDGPEDGKPDVADRQGYLRSPTFTVERPFISFLLGGGPPGSRVHLVVEGKVVRTAAGERPEPLLPCTWDVSELMGREAHLEVVGTAGAGAGHPHVIRFELHDAPRSPGPVARWPDTGSLCLAVVGDGFALPSLREGPAHEVVFGRGGGPVERPFSRRLRGAAGRTFTLEPEGGAEVTFVVSWFLPNAYRGATWVGNRYATRFDGADAVASYVVGHLRGLLGQTRRWHDTYYDSTLPRSLLQRTLADVARRATASRWWANGRFWAREGTFFELAAGGHAWGNEDGLARLFPALERSVRELQDFAPGPGASPAPGAIGSAGGMPSAWLGNTPGSYVLKAHREHRCSPDLAFLRRNWPAIRRATELLVVEGPDTDDLVGAPGSLRLGALRAAEEMALEMGDHGLVERCGRVLDGRDPPPFEGAHVPLGGNGESAPAWSVLSALTGYEYHGPKRHIGFAPRVRPESFRAAFTAAEGWGSYTQERTDQRQRCVLDVAWGRLPLKTMSVAVPEGALVERVTVSAGGGRIRVLGVQEGPRLTLSLPDDMVVEPGGSLDVLLHLQPRG